MLHGRKCEMSESLEKRTREIQDAIRQILPREWIPLASLGALRPIIAGRVHIFI
jgi:hypothetical protein